MTLILSIIAGIFGFITGEAISASLRNDTTGSENNSALTWILKLGSAFLFIFFVQSC